MVLHADGKLGNYAGGIRTNEMGAKYLPVQQVDHKLYPAPGVAMQNRTIQVCEFEGVRID